MQRFMDRLRERSERSKWPLLLVLAFVQFAHVLDFVIVMPLGPQLMRVFDIGPASFGLLVSVYNLSAAAAGLVGVFLLDRFDRKRALLFVFAGFIIGTVGCSLAADEKSLLAARVITGAFGGLIQALLFAIIGDCFDEGKRGAATGTVMSAFSLASIVGVPIALSLADRYDWRTPFLMLTLMAIATWIWAARVLPTMRSHLRETPQIERSPWLMSLRQNLSSTFQLFREENTLTACLLIICLMFAGFTVIPFMSAYLVANVGLREADLATVFLAGGAATLITSRWTGKIADRFGKERVFTWLAALSMIPVFLLTHLPRVPILVAIGIATLFTILISARAIPALAMITSSIEGSRRGAFLSLTSSVQQSASGIASFVAGSFLTLGPHGEIRRYDLAGNFAVFATLLAIIAARRLRRPAVLK
jgi:predicted MFS family arabinose efflux permease